MDYPERNDVAGAVRFYKRMLEDRGEVPRDVYAILVRLQDDPSEFFREMEKLPFVKGPEQLRREQEEAEARAMIYAAIGFDPKND